MAPCKFCSHAGADHEWKVQRIREHCRISECDCRHYVPLTNKPKPSNSFIGRLRREEG